MQTLSCQSIVKRELRAGQVVYVKQHLPCGWLQTPAQLQSQAATEARLIRQLNDLPHEPRIGRLNLIDADPAQARLVTAEVPGQSLQAMLLGARTAADWRRCLRACFLAGRWLRWFQQLSTDTYRGVRAASDPVALKDYCALRFETLRGLNASWPKQTDVATILNWLERTCEESAQHSSRFVWSHGDFGPFNIFWDGHHLTPIDFVTCKPDYELVDLTYLVHRIEMLAIQFPWRNWPVAALRTACIHGYGQPQLATKPLFSALLFRHYLCRYQALVRRPPQRLRQRLHNVWVRGQVRSHLQRLVNISCSS